MNRPDAWEDSQGETQHALPGPNKRKWMLKFEQACVVLFLLSLCFAIFFHSTVDVLPYDDGFITFRYVENVLAGKGLVYNATERVFGSSTPLYVVWLCVLKLVFSSVPVPVLAVRGNVLWFLAAAVGIVVLIRDLSGRATLAVLAASLFAFNLSLLGISAGGMESFLFAALVLWSAWAVLARRFNLAALSASLSILARPEGIFSMGICMIAWLLRDRSRPRRFWMWLLAPALVWFSFATLYFGTPIPHSIIAKGRPLYPLPTGYALWKLLTFLGQWTIAGLGQGNEAWQTGLSLVVVGVAIVECILYGSVGGKDRWIPATLFGLYYVFYSLTNPLIFEWYLPHIYTSWFLTLFVGLPQIGANIDAEISHSSKVHSRLGRAEASCAGLLFLVLVFGVLTPYRQHWASGEAIVNFVRHPSRLRTRGYMEAAQWLNDAAPEFAIVAASEIGSFGYYWHGRVLDGCGLVSPAAIPFLPVPTEETEGPMWGAISTEFVKAARPEFVVTMRIFASKSLLLSDWFADEYREIHKVLLPMRVWDSEYVLIFKRKDVQLRR